VHHWFKEHWKNPVLRDDDDDNNFGCDNDGDGGGEPYQHAYKFRVIYRGNIQSNQLNKKLTRHFNRWNEAVIMQHGEI
jgi:hypothetical protein